MALPLTPLQPVTNATFGVGNGMIRTQTDSRQGLIGGKMRIERKKNMLVTSCKVSQSFIQTIRFPKRLIIH